MRGHISTMALGALAILGAITFAGGQAEAGARYPNSGRAKFMSICAAETPRPICSCALGQFEARMSWADYQRLDRAFAEGRRAERRLEQVANQVFDHCVVNTAY